MINVFGFGKRRAEKLHQSAMALEEAGKVDEAIVKYKEAVQADPDKSVSYYNMGLVYKYRNDWQASYDANRRAYELAPQDQASRWNLGIAATALRDWATARKMWGDDGITIEAGSGPINDNFGQTPVRLNPDGDAEVVWANRIDPVRARIANIPFPESGFRCGDIALHDGAAVGYRQRGERQCPVFNVLELFERSPLGTFQMLIDANSSDVVDELIDAFHGAGMYAEDWTQNVQILCKQCSEGLPHEHEEHAAPRAWQAELRLGIAAAASADVEAVLQAWAGADLCATELQCKLPPVKA